VRGPANSHPGHLLHAMHPCWHFPSYTLESILEASEEAEMDEETVVLPAHSSSRLFPSSAPWLLGHLPAASYSLLLG
jgi:hypothetical protein